MVEQLLLGVLSPLDFCVAEQVIEVPKILPDDVPERTVVRVTQLAEQLVEVPTPVSCMEQIADIPVPGRGVSGCLQGSLPEQSTVKRTASQIADIPVPGRGVSGSLLGSLPVQSTAKRTASQIDDIPVPGRGVSGSLLGSLPVQSTAKRTASQFADIPVPVRGGSDCLPGFHPERKATALHVSQESISERIEQIGAGGDFPSRRAGPRVVLPRQGSAATGAEQLADLASSGGPHGFLPGQVSTASPGADHVDCTCSSLPSGSSPVTTSAGPVTGTDALARQGGSLRRESSGSARRVLEGGSGTGTRIPVPVHMTSLLCLLSEAHRGEGLAVRCRDAA